MDEEFSEGVAQVFAFFEIHDSTLEDLAEEAGLLTLKLKAIRIEWPTPEMEADGEVFTQRIQLDFEGATLSKDSARVPENLLDGSFKADHHDGDFKDPDDYLIPASLRAAEGVRIVLAGTDEDNQDYVTMEIQARSMKLTPLSEPKFLQKFSRPTS